MDNKYLKKESAKTEFTLLGPVISILFVLGESVITFLVRSARDHVRKGRESRKVRKNCSDNSDSQRMFAEHRRRVRTHCGERRDDASWPRYLLSPVHRSAYGLYVYTD